MQNFKIKTILSNSNLTAVLPNGELLFSSEGSKKLFMKLQQCETEEEVRLLMMPELTTEQVEFKRELMKDKKMLSDIEYLLNSGQFYIKENAVYMVGIDVALPKILVQEFISCMKGEVDEVKFNALKNFWYLAILNPNYQSREELFEFLKRGNFKIMANGMVLGYRCVVSTGSKNKNLVEFVSNQYTKIRLKKKATSNYFVFEDLDSKSYFLKGYNDDIDTSIHKQYLEVGNLKELYLNLPNLEENTYTDQHSKSFTIKISEEVKMDRKAADENPSQDCSRGLHLCSDLKDYMSFGDTKLLVAFSPRNVISVPESATTKMRVCAYMPLAVLHEEDYRILDDADTLELVEEYYEKEIDNLEEMAQKSTVQDLKKNYLLSAISQSTFNNILNKLDDYKNTISTRVVELS